MHIIIITVVEWEVGGSRHVKIIASHAGWTVGSHPPIHLFKVSATDLFAFITMLAIAFINYTVAFMFTFYK